MEFFDTHAHLNFKDYSKDRENVIKGSLKESVFMVNVGTNLKESERVVRIAKKYKDGVYASVGLHPLYTESEDFLPKNYERLAKNEKTVAVGETGLDYKYTFQNTGEKTEEERKRRQQKVFKQHINLARDLNLPLIIHCRKAHQDTIATLKSVAGSDPATLSGVVHCFSGGKKEADEYLNLGFYLGINGIIFKMNLEKTIREIPLERILIETDCPFLTPPPEKGRNQPLFVKHIAKEVARIKGISIKDVAEATTKSAKELFNIDL